MSDSDRIAALEEQIATLQGQTATLHPHGSRTGPHDDGRQMEILQDNIARLFDRLKVLEGKVSAQQPQVYRAGEHVRIQGNVISVDWPPPPLPPALINATLCDASTGTETLYNLVYIPSVGGAP